MKLFLFFLKRDLRLLFPVNMIIFMIFIVATFLTKLLQLRSGGVFDEVHFSVIVFLLFFFSLLSVIAIIIESIWREWRKGTQFDWYLYPGSMHVKLISKVIAIFIWQYFQLIVAICVVVVLLFWTGDDSFRQDLFIGEFSVIDEFSWEYLWGLIIVPFVAIVQILFGCLLFFGLKSMWRFFYVMIYTSIVFILYPYVYIKLYPTAEPVETEPILRLILDVNHSQFIFDVILALSIYGLMYIFAVKKLEL